MTEIQSLWGDEFSLKEDDIKKILTKSKTKKVVKEVSIDKQLKSKKVSIEDKMALIEEDVNRILGSFKNDTLTIRDYNEFKSYIDKSIENGIIAVDTETNNTTNTFDCLLMGLCLYTPGLKNAYIPVNHVYDYELGPKYELLSGKKLNNQITEQQIHDELQRLVDNNVKIIFHNAVFDIEVLQTTCNIRLKAYWDTMVAAQLINENELKGLKVQYKLHCNPEQDKYDIEHLFKGLPYAIFDPELFALYAATDSFETYEVYKYQLNIITNPDHKDVYKLFREIEIPVIDAIVNMELAGVEIDLDYAKKMSIEYHKRSDEVQSRIDAELNRLSTLIDNWKLTPEANNKPLNKKGTGYSKSKVEQLSDPIDLGSPTQMAILLYDILKAPIVDKKKPRTTDAAALKTFAEEKHIKICELLLEKREVDILINTFIDKLPEFVQKDGRVHARFNQCGTVSGRFSSSEPNLQQIPSHDKAIRMMFKAGNGCSLVGSDYSGQEMRVLASVSNDKEMINAYENNQDIYARVASLIYKNDYKDNLEFRPGTGELQPDGKKRRASAKTVALGLNYGMSVNTLAGRLGESLEDAQAVVDGYYGGLIGVKKYTEDSQKMLREFGYVTDIFGRRRHIPDGQLEEFEVKPLNENNYFNPLIGSIKHENKELMRKISSYKDKLSKTKYKKDVDKIIDQAKRDGLLVKNNKGFINRAARQTLNSRIQGGSASMTKLAMVMINNDKELNDLGFKLLVTVHDEVYGECPTENSYRAGERLCEVMVNAAKVKCSNVPWKCDPYIVKRWYSDECSSDIRNEYNKLIKEESKESAFNKIKTKYNFIQEKYLREMCDDIYDPNKYSDI